MRHRGIGIPNLRRAMAPPIRMAEPRNFRGFPTLGQYTTTVPLGGLLNSGLRGGRTVGKGRY